MSIPPAAQRLHDLAVAAGLTVEPIQATKYGDVVQVVGHTDEIGFAATWRDGRAVSGTWHEPKRRYELVRDKRPPWNAPVKSGVKRRPKGMDEMHVKLVAGPEGVPVGVLEITRRLREMAK